MWRENNEIIHNTEKESHIECSEFHKKKKKISNNILQTLNTEQNERENNCKIVLEEEKEKLGLLVEQLL